MNNYTGSVPDTVARPLDWMDRMACRDERKLFDDRSRANEARVVCLVRCRERTACLAYVKRLEAGASRAAREGVVAGLTWHERWRLDPEATGHEHDAPPLAFTGAPPRCGTYAALLRHLWFGQKVDPECWSGEVRRERLRKASGVTHLPDDLAEAS